MARKTRRTGSSADEPQIRVKALKLTGRKNFILRWTDPATGKLREESTEVPALDKNRRKAIRAATDRESELQDIIDRGGEIPLTKSGAGASVADVVKAHVAWVAIHRSPDLHKQRKSLLAGFTAHKISGDLPGTGSTVATLYAKAVTPAHVAQFIEAAERPDTTRRAIAVAIKATWNWASDNGLLPKTFRPLSSVPRGRVGPRDLTEAELPTTAEIEAILRWSSVATSRVRAGTGRWRRRRPDEFFETADAKTLGDMMHAYHSTGARTGELCAAEVRDFMPSTNQLCLGKHKRSATEKCPTVRNIQLVGKALEIVRQRCKGRDPKAPLFARATGQPWTQVVINRQFREVRILAGEHNQPIRPHVTPYSFRHLYISELLTIGTPTYQVAKMAGTSVREIERTYGHFFNRDLASAQRKLEAHRARRKVGESKGGNRHSHPKG